MNKAEKNSIPYFLKPEINLHNKALQLIHEKGIKHGNKDIREKYYPEFQKVDEDLQIKLIKKISVLDGALTIKDVKNKIKFLISNDIEDEFVEKYYRELYGWW